MYALPGELVLSDVHREVFQPARQSSETKTVLSRFQFSIILDGTTEDEEEKSGPDKDRFDEDGDLIVIRRQEKIMTEVIKIEHMMSTEVSRVGLQHILELGSGTGITSILLASTNVAGIFCTDTGSDVLIQCQKNISSNTHLTSRDREMTPEAESKVLVRELDWTHDSLNEDTQNAFHWRQNDKELMQQVKFIVAADVIYDDNLTDAFFRILQKLMKENHIQRAFIALEKRINFSLDDLDVSSPAHDHFLQWVEVLKKTEGFDCRQMKTSFPKRFNYTRTKQLELWQITFSHVRIESEEVHPGN
ncbi:putative methyltransferase-like protein 22 [Apostichopus japonicus]|uniref:Putative methyltransferase-like protein 22 n=1 Tax=Stichopus japonicus TaxID=307972 RepID=A0A2G8JHM4_STIJA|nr:putative methyltransferase-like protein 22 [Apostichopus japonicus]